MWSRLWLLLLAVSIVQLSNACSEQKVGGWQASSDDPLQEEVLTLARQQLDTTSDLASEPIEVVSFNKQVVAGTNLRLVFLAGDLQQCTLQAFKPLPYTNKPIEVTSFECEDIA